MADFVVICGPTAHDERVAAARVMLAATGSVVHPTRDTHMESVNAAPVFAVAHQQRGTFLGCSDTPLTIASGDAALVLADSRLTYRSDLLTKVRTTARRQRDDSATDAELILDLFEAHGPASFSMIEGEFAFVLWDRREQRIHAVRDFIGRHRLLYAVVDGDLVVTTSPAHLRAHPRGKFSLNKHVLGKVVSSMWGHGHETVFQGITDVPAGGTITWSPGSDVQVKQIWHPPDEFDHTLSTADATERLRTMLYESLGQQLEWQTPTAVSLSGGWDSPAVFAAGQQLLRVGGHNSSLLLPVSMSYPEGDTGREDELISQVCSHWHVKSNWIDIAHVPMLHDLETRARKSMEPDLHFFASFNRALFRKARELGATRILDGYGGDNLFDVTMVYLADVLRAGRPLETLRQWRARGGTGWRDLFKSAVLPNLGPRSIDLLATVRGGQRPAFWLDRKPAPWIRSPFLKQYDIERHDRMARVLSPSKSATLRTMHAMLTFPFFARVNAHLRRISLEEGVTLGSPLADNRIVQFVGARPWQERSNMRETKILLRLAMRGLLPDSFLAPRLTRTGTPQTYFRNAVRNDLRPFAEALPEGSVLADMGIIAPAAFAWGWDKFLETDDTAIATQLLSTVQVELWVRGQTGAPPLVRETR